MSERGGQQTRNRRIWAKKGTIWRCTTVRVGSMVLRAGACERAGAHFWACPILRLDPGKPRDVIRLRELKLLVGM